MSFRSAFLFTLALSGVVAPAYAQDDLARLASTDANGFVRAVQESLRDAGTYDGAVSGVLDQRTISAINDACRAVGVIAQCQLGPLSPKGAQAVASAVTGLNAAYAPETASAPHRESEPDASPADEVVSAEAPEAIAVEWKASSSRNGIEVAGSLSGEAFQASFAGTAIASDWTNIDSSNVIEALPGETWTLALSAETALSGEGTATARIAAFGLDNKYLGELGSGAPLTSNEAMEYSTSGETPEGTIRIAPYIQLRYSAGAVANDTVTIFDAVVTRK